jgi:hypothetical protein
MTLRYQGRNARGIPTFVIRATSRPPIRNSRKMLGKRPNSYELGNELDHCRRSRVGKPLSAGSVWVQQIADSGAEATAADNE